MTITIKIDTGNAAFEDDRDAEVLRILSEHFARVPRVGYDGKLYDYNGNRVGSVTVRGK